MKKIDKNLHNWCKFNPKFNHKDPNYGKFLDFYLWDCPSPNTAYGSKKFEDYGWKGGHNFKKLKRELIISNEIPFIVPNKNNLIKAFENQGQLGKFSIKETIILLKPSLGEMDALFRSIRNALAHGSFHVRKYQGEFYYFFENRRNGQLRARIVLNSQTLNSWIKVVKNGPFR